MFHWICPECGREIPPAKKECVACDPAAAAAEVAEHVLVQAKAGPVAAAAGPARTASVTKPGSPARDGGVAVDEIVRVQTRDVPSSLEAHTAAAIPPAPAAEVIASTAAAPEKPALVQATPEPSAAAPRPVAEVKAPAPAPEIVHAKPEPVADAPLAAPSIEVKAPGIPLETVVQAIQVTQEPLVLDRKPVAPIRAAAPVAAPVEPIQAAPPAPVKPHVPALIDPPAAEPETDPMFALAEMVRAAQSGPVQTESLPALAVAVGLVETPAAPVTEPSLAPAAAAPVEPHTAAQTATQPVALMAPPEPAPVPVETVAPGLPAPVPQPTALPAVPVVRNLVEAPIGDQPPSGSWLQLAPLQDYASAATRKMQPIALKPRILTPDPGPRITLPGPALPPKLERLHDAGVVTVIGEQSNRASRKNGMPGWLVSLLVMLSIPMAGVAVVFYFQPNNHATSADATPPPAQEAPQQAATGAPASHPVSQMVEVTGFRIVVDFNKKSEIHYLVVNHSAADLSDMTIFVTLRAASAKAGQPPLSRFSFRAPNLAPFESKEMVSPIEKLTRAVTLPDWQDLRAEVQIGQ